MAVGAHDRLRAMSLHGGMSRGHALPQQPAGDCFVRASQTASEHRRRRILGYESLLSMKREDIRSELLLRCKHSIYTGHIPSPLSPAARRRKKRHLRSNILPSKQVEGCQDRRGTWHLLADTCGDFARPRRPPSRERKNFTTA